MNAYAKKAKELKTKLDSGKLKGKALENAKKYYYWASWKAKQPKVKKTAKVTKGKPKNKQVRFDPKQGILPNFLSQLNTVRIEEMVAERIFQAISENIKNSQVPPSLTLTKKA